MNTMNLRSILTLKMSHIKSPVVKMRGRRFWSGARCCYSGGV